jgi:hypothetical protein
MKFTFILYDVSLGDIDTKYAFNIKSNIDTRCFNNNNKTNISDLNKLDNTKKYYSYFDEAKKEKRAIITMYNQIGKNLPKTTDIHCYWCSHQFNNQPLGCPIEYKTNAYTTDGIFCSFNCCLAHINNNPHNKMYEYSNVLLHQIYFKLFGQDNTIKPASEWRLLEKYGGPLTIEEFRQAFNSLMYKNIDSQIKNIPEQHSIGWLYEENITF